jgi:hypothetical protein
MSLLEKNAKERSSRSDTGQKERDPRLVFNRKHQEKLLPHN